MSDDTTLATAEAPSLLPEDRSQLLSMAPGRLWVQDLGPVQHSTQAAQEGSEAPVLTWYVFDEPSGAFAEAARRCGEGSGGAGGSPAPMTWPC